MNTLMTKETTALQIVAVIAWLWVMPVIDMFESYSYGSATISLIRSYVPFVLGIILAVNIPKKVNDRIRHYSRDLTLIMGN